MKMGGSRQGKRIPCQTGYPVFPHPSLGPPHRVKHPINLFTYNAASGGIIKEAVLILNVVPGNTKKADCQPISAPVSWDHCHPGPEEIFRKQHSKTCTTHILTCIHSVCTLLDPVIRETYHRNVSQGKYIQQKKQFLKSKCYRKVIHNNVKEIRCNCKI